MLSVTISGTATVTYRMLRAGGAQGPIPGAYVSVQFVDSNNQPHTISTAGVTGADGAYSVSLDDPNVTLKSGSNVTVTLQAGIGALLPNQPPMTQFWMENPANNEVWTATVSGSPEVLTTDPTSFTLNVNVDGGINSAVQPAFEIYATVQNVYVPYVQSLGLATLSHKLQINYSATNAPSGDFVVSDGGVPQLNISSYVTTYPDILGHEFGHYVAYEAGFFEGFREPFAEHSVGYNHRFYKAGPAPWAGNINNLLPLSTNDEVLAFEEGFADWFAVAGKTWYKKQPGVNQDAPAALVAMTTGTLFDYGGTIYGGRNTFNINDDNPVYTLARGSDDEGSVARILWGLTTNSKKPYGTLTDAQLFQSIRTYLALTIPDPSNPGMTMANPAQPTLDALTKALSVFVDKRHVNAYAPLYEAYNVSPTTVTMGYDNAANQFWFQFDLPLVKYDGQTNVQDPATLQKLSTFNSLQLSFAVNAGDSPTAVTVPISVSFGANGNLSAISLVSPGRVRLRVPHERGSMAAVGRGKASQLDHGHRVVLGGRGFR